MTATITEGPATMLLTLDGLIRAIKVQTDRMLAGDLSMIDYHAWFLRDVQPAADALTCMTLSGSRPRPMSYRRPRTRPIKRHSSTS
jgi:hypothetical protein